MGKIVTELSAKQLEQAVARLPLAEQARLAKRLEQQLRRARWEPLVLTMRQRAARRGLSARQVRRLCEQVRQERFDREQRAARRR